MRAVALGFVAFLLLVTAAAGTNPVRATLATSTPKPVVDQPWRYTIRVQDQAGKPVRARMRLQLLLGTTTVVGCWKGSAMTQCQTASEGTWIAFKGKRTGVLTFPTQSVGVRLTFQAVVVAGGRTVRLRAPVTVQPAP